MFNLFKKKKSQQGKTPQQMECPKCGGTMTLTSGLSRIFHCKDQDVEVPDITGMLCTDCGELMFDWSEATRIEEYVHKAVGWEDVPQ